MTGSIKTSIRFRIILVILVTVILTFLLTAIAVLYPEVKKEKADFERTVELVKENKKLDLNATLKTIENSVRLSEDYILKTLDDKRIEKDFAYEKEYMDRLEEEMIRLSQGTHDAVALYFRLEHDRFGDARGIFLTGNSKQGFIRVKNTSLLEYSPNDTEHVGWYYIPVWAKKPVWTNPYENKNINIVMMSYIIPIYKQGQLLGIVGMDINLATIKGIIDSVPLENMLCLLIGSENNIIYTNTNHSLTPSVSQTASTDAIMDLISNNGKKVLNQFFWDGTEYLGQIQPLDNGMSLVAGIPLASLRDFQIQICVILAVVLILVLTLALLVNIYSSKKIISPLQEMTNATFRLSRGELNTKLAYQSKNEMGTLADNIRKMTDQMRDYFEYIRNQTEKERKAKEEAIAESENKSKFLASMYISLHEIDLNEDVFSEIHSRTDVAKNIGSSFKNARATVRRVMEDRVKDKGKPREDFMDFINFDTLEERMKGKITIAHEFLSITGSWCRARFILMDRNEDGTLHHVLWAVEDVSSERAERELLRSEAEKNAAANQAKSAFLANMSHEIRTPINAVLGMDEMILRESEDQAILEYAVNIKNAGANLLEIVNEILDFSKIEAGKMEILPDNYDISSLVVDLVNMINERAKKKELAFIINADPNLPKTLYGDSVRIKQCVLNLLTNAVKYTKEGSVTFTVNFEKISGSTDKIKLTMSVKDTGIGIKNEDMEKLCSPFERIEEEKNKTIEGTGLGMSIVTRLLSMMGTKLEVKSVYGEGSEFSFSVEQSVVDWTSVGDINEAYKKNAIQIAGYKEKLHAPKAHLLFVDDTEMNLEVIKGLLKKTGIKIDTALSGKKTLELVKENVYDILFIDHRMPEMDGIETLHAMKSLEGNLCKDKPCIALTANAISGVKQMYIKEGFTNYLSKPVDPEKLEELIRKYLPKDYIEEGDSSEFEENQADEGENDFLEKLKLIEEIDLAAALKNCVSEELLEKSVKKYHDDVTEKAEELQNLYENEDWKLYCTKVHGLKTTSRIIGALSLSAQAEHLEHCADSGDIDEIHKKHKPFLEEYLALKEKLAPLAEEENSEKSEISETEFLEKLNKIGEMVKDFDIDGLDSIIQELSQNAIPEQYAEKFEKIRVCVENVDFATLKTLI